MELEVFTALAIPKKFGSELNSVEFPVAPPFAYSGRRLHDIWNARIKGVFRRRLCLFSVEKMVGFGLDGCWGGEERVGAEAGVSGGGSTTGQST